MQDLYGGTRTDPKNCCPFCLGQQGTCTKDDPCCSCAAAEDRAEHPEDFPEE
jgi:hypothetical protein